MRIEKLSFHNHVTGWQLAPMEFGSVNLLVGVSGVGKTKILEVIYCLQNIACSEFWHDNTIFNGVEWDVVFSISSNSQYRWHGKFNILDSNLHRISESIYSRSDRNKISIETEKLYLNENLIADREDGVIIFNSQAMPKLSVGESLVAIFRSEDKIIPVINAWRLIIDSQAQCPEKWLSGSMLSKSKIDELSLSDISNSGGTLVELLGSIWINDRQMFDRIKSSFLEIFPQVEDFRTLIKKTRVDFSEQIFCIFSLELKEVGVDKWITQSNLSMGMLKTLAHIVEIYLLPEGSILLIDEFENSLGVNCIDVVTDLLNDRKDIQFIFTSHHPYIINKIPMQYWKIITRKGSLITATNANDYEELSGSKHKIFTQLLNLPAYTEGIQVG